MPQRIAYLTNQYPRASDTFIRTEVKHLRANGWILDTYAVRRPDEAALVSEDIRREYENTTYLRDGGWLQLVWAFLKCLGRRPLRTVRAFRLAWRTGVPGCAGRAKSFLYLMEAARLASQLQSSGAQHLHNHIGENSATVAMLASELGGVPFSLTIHGPGIFYHPRQWALGEKIRRSQFTAAITHFCRSQCMVFAPYAEWDKIIVVRCCVDAAFLSQPITDVTEDCRLLFIGRLCEEKGVPFLIEAVARLRNLGRPFELNIIGDGPMRRTIEELISKHQLQGFVHLLGFQSSQRIAEELIRSRALILPSFAEGLPVVIMESLAVGRPVITTRIAGIPELVDEQCGWLVPPGDINSLSSAIQDCFQSSSERLTAMGREGRRRVKQLHDADVALEPLVTAIKNSLKNCGLSER